jgi:hypothetical protein
MSISFLRRQSVVLGLSVLAVTGSSHLNAQAAPTTSVGFYQVGRTSVNPITGQGFAYGYYAGIAGISVPPFAGTPSEKTAFFTFRSSVFQLLPLPTNGDVTNYLVGADTFNVYYNASPAGDFSNPDSFSSGTLVATYSRAPFLLTLFTATGGGSEDAFVTSSQTFAFNGSPVNFGVALPHVVITSSYSTTPLPGVGTFPGQLAFSGYSLAAALPSGSTTTPPTATLTASPNPISASGATTGSTTLTWSAPTAQVIEIHIGSPSGTLFTRNTNSGSDTTGNWVTNGMVFYLQDVSNGLPLTAANTLATVTVSLK